MMAQFIDAYMRHLGSISFKYIYFVLKIHICIQ